MVRVAFCVLVLAALVTGCFSPDVDVDTSGLRRPSSSSSSSRRVSPSSSSGSASNSVLTSRVEDVEDDAAKLEKKLNDLKDDLKKLEDRVKKVEKKLD